MICTALFTTTSVNSTGAQGAFYLNGLLLGKTLLVLVIIVPWFFIFTWGCLFVTDKILKLRVSGETGVHVAPKPLEAVQHRLCSTCSTCLAPMLVCDVVQDEATGELRHADCTWCSAGQWARAFDQHVCSVLFCQ